MQVSFHLTLPWLSWNTNPYPTTQKDRVNTFVARKVMLHQAGRKEEWVWWLAEMGVGSQSLPLLTPYQSIEPNKGSNAACRNQHTHPSNDFPRLLDTGQNTRNLHFRYNLKVTIFSKFLAHGSGEGTSR